MTSENFQGRAEGIRDDLKQLEKDLSLKSASSFCQGEDSVKRLKILQEVACEISASANCLITSLTETRVLIEKSVKN